jgi:two-component system sensor histidine kinase HydH
MDLRSPRIQVALIWLSIAALSLLLWIIPPDRVETLNFLHHLNFIPLLLAGMLLGWRMTLATTAFAFVAQIPYIWLTATVSAINALDQLVELSLFGVAGIAAGFLSDRERGQRTRLEKTTRELEAVYHELRQNIEKLKKAERLHAAGQLSASLAHEIRNPLASVSGAAAILKRGDMSSRNFADCLEIIDKESQRLNKLLSNFLEFARPRAPRFQATDLAAVIQSVITLASHMSGGSIDFEQRMHPGLPEIHCDPEQLKQVLLNLLINATQAMPDRGTVVISAWGEDGRGRVVITVQDQGTGLDPEAQDRIFDPFFTTKENGSGLGLAIAAKIIEQHGGQLSAKNNEDKGVTFRIELPVEQAGIA